MRTIVKKLNIFRFFILYICIFVLFTPSTTRADRLTEEQVRLAVTTWVRQVTADARPDAVIERMESHTVGHRIMAYIAHLKGGGYCLCGRDDWVLPVYLYSPKGQPCWVTCCSRDNTRNSQSAPYSGRNLYQAQFPEKAGYQKNLALVWI